MTPMPMADLNKSNLANKMTKKLTKIVSPHNKIVYHHLQTCYKQQLIYHFT